MLFANLDAAKKEYWRLLATQLLYPKLPNRRFRATDWRRIENKARALYYSDLERSRALIVANDAVHRINSQAVDPSGKSA